MYFSVSAPELLHNSAATLPARSLQHIMVELCLATVTGLVPQGPHVIRLEDSVLADNMSLGDNAQSVPQDIMASPTADVSKLLLVSCFDKTFTYCV